MDRLSFLILNSKDIDNKKASEEALLLSTIPVLSPYCETFNHDATNYKHWQHKSSKAHIIDGFYNVAWTKHIKKIEVCNHRECDEKE